MLEVFGILGSDSSRVVFTTENIETFVLYWTDMTEHKYGG
jgi:hypothetical protein